MVVFNLVSSLLLGGSKTSKASAPSQKQIAPAGRAPPEKASECLVRRRLCRRWAESYPYPASIADFSWGACIASLGKGPQEPGAPPWLWWAGLQAPGKITTTKLHYFILIVMGVPSSPTWNNRILTQSVALPFLACITQSDPGSSANASPALTVRRALPSTSTMKVPSRT